MLITKVQKTATTISLVIVYLALWYVAAIFEYGPFASLWYAPAGLSVAILILWKKDGFFKVWLCVWCVSVLTQYTYVDNPNLFRVVLVSISAAFTHTVPYWLAIKTFRKIQTALQSKPEGLLVQPALYAILLLIGSLGAALLGILTQIVFADMSVIVAKNIWLGWWIGDYVGVVVLAPIFIFVACKYMGKLTNPQDIFLLNHSHTKDFLPKEKLSIFAWVLIALLPAIVAIARVELDDRIPEVLAFLLVLLPIAILSTRATWGVLVSSTVMSSVLIIITVKYFGIIGDAMAYQATLLAIAVTSLYFYDFVKNFELRAQELLDTERSLSTASKLLTLNEIGANIAHELCTPLQTALSSSQRVRRRLEKRDDDWSVEVGELNNVRDAIGQASDIVESVRNLVKMPKQKSSCCSINDTLILVRKLVASSAEKQAVQIHITDKQKFDLVKIEQSELIQILENLISNSIRSAAQTSTKEVTVSLNQADDKSVSVEVTDSGKGIAKTDLNNLFKPGHSRSIDGLGLGLWVSRSIAERRGSTLEYIYNDDINWCFRLTLSSKESEQ